jgi:hypothetical protein
MNKGPTSAVRQRPEPSLKGSANTLSTLSQNLRIDLNQNIEKALAFRLGSIGAQS